MDRPWRWKRFAPGHGSILLAAVTLAAWLGMVPLTKASTGGKSRFGKDVQDGSGRYPAAF